VCQHVATLKPDFISKSDDAQKSMVHCFLAQYALSTEEEEGRTMYEPPDLIQHARDFVKTAQTALQSSKTDLEYMINVACDIMAHNLDMMIPTSFVEKTDPGRKKQTYPKQVIQAWFSFMASGSIMAPHIEFHVDNESNPPVDTGTLPSATTYATIMPEDHQFALSPNWINQVLIPHLSKKPKHVQPVLLIDFAIAQYGAEVSQQLQQQGLIVFVIPDGCALVLQPFDIGLRDAYVGDIRQMRQAWFKSKSVAEWYSSVPSWHEASNWIIKAWKGTPCKAAYACW
jgi:DDE superfamily endonuclease